MQVIKVQIIVSIVLVIAGCSKTENPELVNSLLFSGDGSEYSAELTCDKDTIFVNSATKEGTFTLTNTGTANVTYNLSYEANNYWMEFSDWGGEIGPGQSITTTVVAKDFESPQDYPDATLNVEYLAKKLEIPVIYSWAELQVSTINLFFNKNETEKKFTISNYDNANSDINWTITENISWLNVNTTSGTNNAEITAVVDRSGFTDGYYSGVIQINSDFGNKEIKVVMQVGDVTINPEVYSSIPEGLKVDYFIENFDDNTNEWPEVDNYSCYSEVNYGNTGRYYLVNKTSSSTYFFTNNVVVETGRDFEIETNLSVYADNNGNGLVFGRSNSTNQNFYFTFNDEENNHTIGYYSDGYWTPWQNWTPGYITSGMNKLTVRKYANKFYFFINQEFVYEHNVVNFYGHDLGFQVMAGAKVYVDFLTVKYIGLEKSNEDNFMRPIINKSKVVAIKNSGTY